MPCAETETVSLLPWALNSSPLTPSVQIPAAFGNATRQGTSATFTAVSAIPFAPVNRQAAACAEPEFTRATELPWSMNRARVRLAVSRVLM